MKDGPFTPQDRKALWLRLSIRLLLALLFLLAIIRFGRPLLSLTAPFLLAAGTAMLLHPLICHLQRRTGLSRPLLTLFVILFLLGLVGSLLVLLVCAAGQELLLLAQNWDSLLTALQEMLDQLEVLFARFWQLLPHQLYDSVQSVTDGLLGWLNTTIPTLVYDALDYTKNKAIGIPSFAVALVIYLLAAFFLTVDYPQLRIKAARFLPPSLFRFVNLVRTTTLTAFGGYLKAQFLLSCCVFGILLAGFLLIRQPYGLLLAATLSLMDFIPIVGAGTVMVPWAIFSLFTGGFSTAAKLISIWGVIALFRQVMEPKFVGDQTGLSPILSLVGIYTGMKIAGIAGMVLAPILLMVLVNLSHMGLFSGIRADLADAFWDLSSILTRPADPN